jgi:hypothetical protein
MLQIDYATVCHCLYCLLEYQQSASFTLYQIHQSRKVTFQLLCLLYCFHTLKQEEKLPMKVQFSPKSPFSPK